MRLLISRHPQSIPHLILLFHHKRRKLDAHAQENKQRPLPPKRIDSNAKREPPDQFRVREEIKGSRGALGLDKLGHVDPELHPVRRGTGEGVDEEHEEDAGVDANVEVADCADCVYVGAVVCADGSVLWREGLEVPFVMSVFCFQCFAL